MARRTVKGVRDDTLDECAALARAAAQIPFTDARVIDACNALANRFVTLKQKGPRHVRA